MWNMLGKGSADKIEIHSHAIGNIVCVQGTLVQGTFVHKEHSYEVYCIRTYAFLVQLLDIPHT